MDGKKEQRSSTFKRIYQSIHSMKFGMVLLLIIGVLSIIGTILPQDRPLSFYEEEYNAFFYGVIEIFQLNRVYTSWWFIAMILILSLNLILCSIIRLPKLLKSLKNEPKHPDQKNDKVLMVFNDTANENPKEIFKICGFKSPKKLSAAEGELYYGKKNTIGHLGSWFTHIGLLIIFISYLFGQIAGYETFFYGVPGVQGRIGDTPYELAIEDFTIDYREDHSIEQYTSRLRVYHHDENTLVKEGVSKVNDPMRVDGFSIYQNGTGWALDLNLYKEEESLRELTLYEGEIHVDDDQRIAIQFYSFYPDYIHHQGMPATKTPFPENPHMLYVLFYEGFRVDMNVAGMGEEIVYGEYSFNVEAPRQFTYLQIVRDPGIPGAFAGGVMLILGVFLAFYIHPKTLFLRKIPGEMHLFAKAPRGEKLFHNELKKRLKEGTHWE